MRPVCSMVGLLALALAPAPVRAAPADDPYAEPRDTASGAATADSGGEATAAASPNSNLDAASSADPAHPPRSDASAPSSAPSAEILLTSPLAGAPAVSSHRYGSVSSKGSESILLPSGALELSGEVVFISGEDTPLGQGLKFTDLALLRLGARRAFEGLELYATTQLLAKQPERTDELVWQGSAGGVRIPFARWFAGAVEGSLGPLLGHGGTWYALHPHLMGKAELGEYARMELALGELFTVLDARDAEALLHIDEIAAHVEAQLGERSGGFWLGFEYCVPVSSAPDARELSSGLAIDPTTRLGVHAGGFLTSGHWDLYLTLGVIDRGDASAPASTLPIIDGGFDQQQITFGVQRRLQRRPPGIGALSGNEQGPPGAD